MVQQKGKKIALTQVCKGSFLTTYTSFVAIAVHKFQMNQCHYYKKFNRDDTYE